MKKEILKEIYDSPIIGAINDVKDINSVINSPCKVVFLLTGDILNLEDMTKLLQRNNKLVCIHVDLIGGFSRDSIALKYINNNINPDGIITTKTNIVKAAKELNIFAIQRLFLLDSLALESGISSIIRTRPDAVEVLPGIMPKIIRKLTEETRTPIIAGGLIQDKTDVIESLNAGAIGISKRFGICNRYNLKAYSTF